MDNAVNRLDAVLQRLFPSLPEQGRWDLLEALKDVAAEAVEEHRSAYEHTSRDRY